MTGKDLQTFVTFLVSWSQGRSLSRILAVNPDVGQEAVLQGFFPRASVVSLAYPAIDLSKGVEERYDVIFVANTMLCAPDPGIWIRNCLEACDELWVQDLVRAWRNGDRELSPETGDVSRFTFPSAGEESRVPGYDLLADVRFAVPEVKFYSDSPSPEGKDCLKFIAAIRRNDHSGATRGRDELPTPLPSPAGGDDQAGGGTKKRRSLPL